MIEKHTLQFITPCFCRGADDKIVEPRGSSIKGILRFWFRAIGCFNGLEDMKGKETEVFGGTIKKSGKEIQKPSPIKLKIISNENSVSEEKYSFIPGRSIKYKSLKKIDLEFIQRNYKNSDKNSNGGKKYDYMKVYSELLTLVSILGGIGARTRRGYGCFNVLNQDEKRGKGIGKYLEEKLNLFNKYINNKSNGKKIYCIVKKENRKNNFNKYWEIERSVKNENDKYPFIEKIYIKEIEKDKDCNKKLNIYYNKLKIIKDFTHERKNNEYINYNNKEKNQLMDSLGCGGSNNRFASPVNVSICEYKQKSYLIITELNNTKKPVDDKEVKEKLEQYTDKFINDILERC